MKNFGKVGKELRISRGLTQEQAGGTIKTSTMSRFENENNMKLSNFVVWIENVGLTYEEYFFAVNNYELTSYEALIHKATKLYANNQEQAVKKMLRDYKLDMNPSKKNVYETLNFVVLKNLLHQWYGGEKLTSQEKKKVSTHLLSIQDWANYELFLYGNVMQAFGTDDIIKLSNELIIRSSQFGLVSKNKRIVSEILVNTAIALLNRGELTRAKHFKRQAEKQLDDLDLFNRTILIFASGEIDFLSGEIQKGMKEMEKAITIFELTEREGLASLYQKAYEKIIKETRNPENES